MSGSASIDLRSSGLPSVIAGFAALRSRKVVVGTTMGQDQHGVLARQVVMLAQWTGEIYIPETGFGRGSRIRAQCDHFRDDSRRRQRIGAFLLTRPNRTHLSGGMFVSKQAVLIATIKSGLSGQSCPKRNDMRRRWLRTEQDEARMRIRSFEEYGTDPTLR